MIKFFYPAIFCVFSSGNAIADSRNIVCTEFYLSSEDETHSLANIEVNFNEYESQKYFTIDGSAYPYTCIGGTCFREETENDVSFQYRHYLAKSTDFSPEKPIYVSRSVYREVNIVTGSIKQEEFNGQLICESELSNNFISEMLPSSITEEQKSITYSGYDIARINSCLVRLEMYANQSKNMFESTELPDSFQANFSRGYLYAAVPEFYKKLQETQSPSVREEQQADLVEMHLNTSNAWFDAMDCTRDLVHYKIMGNKKY